VVAGLAEPVENPWELTAAWRQRIEAATRAEESGHDAEAENLLKAIVTRAEKAGAVDLRLADALERLAGFYCSKKRKRYLEAEALFLRSLAIREKIQGAVHPDVANTLASLGACQFITRGESDSAGVKSLQRSLAVYETRKGKEDPEVARVLTLLSAAQLQRGATDAAQSALTRAAVIREKVFGSESPELAAVLDHLAVLHIMRAADYVRDVFGEGSRTAAALILGDIDAMLATNRAGKTIADRETKMAESFYKRALEMRERSLKPDDPAIAESVYNLGQLAVLLDRPTDCVPYFERWLDLQHKRNAPESENQATALCWLSVSAVERGEFDKAERLLARTQAAFEKVKGPGCGEILSTLSMRVDSALEAG
jgi:tetratricopeptide (TPR) repeat protein